MVLAIVALAALDSAIGGWGAALGLFAGLCVGLAFSPLRGLGWALVGAASVAVAAALAAPSILFLPAACALLIAILAAVGGHLAADLRRARRPD